MPLVLVAHKPTVPYATKEQPATTAQADNAKAREYLNSVYQTAR